MSFAARRRHRSPRPGLCRCVGQALATEAIAECMQESAAKASPAELRVRSDALGQMSMAHQPPAAIIGELVGMAAEPKNRESPIRTRRYRGSRIEYGIARPVPAPAAAQGDNIVHGGTRQTLRMSFSAASMSGAAAFRRALVMAVLACLYRKLDSAILVMKPAEDRL